MLVSTPIVSKYSGRKPQDGDTNGKHMLTLIVQQSYISSGEQALTSFLNHASIYICVCIYIYVYKGVSRRVEEM